MSGHDGESQGGASFHMWGNGRLHSAGPAAGRSRLTSWEEWKAPSIQAPRDLLGGWGLPRPRPPSSQRARGVENALGRQQAHSRHPNFLMTFPLLRGLYRTVTLPGLALSLPLRVLKTKAGETLPIPSGFFQFFFIWTLFLLDHRR